MESKKKSLFERIIDGELPASRVYEDAHILAIHDIDPRAPVHILIIPKRCIPSLQAVTAEDYPLITEVIKVAQLLAKSYGLDESGYRLLTNHGDDAGQTIFHLHFHLLGGAPLVGLG